MAFRRYCDKTNCQRENLIEEGDTFYGYAQRTAQGFYAQDIVLLEFCTKECLCEHISAS